MLVISPNRLSNTTCEWSKLKISQWYGIETSQNGNWPIHAWYWNETSGIKITALYVVLEWNQRNGNEYLHGGWEAVCSKCGFKEVGHNPEAYPQCDRRPVLLRSWLQRQSTTRHIHRYGRQRASPIPAVLDSLSLPEVCFSCQGWQQFPGRARIVWRWEELFPSLHCHQTAADAGHLDQKHCKKKKQKKTVTAVGAVSPQWHSEKFDWLTDNICLRVDTSGVSSLSLTPSPFLSLSPSLTPPSLLHSPVSRVSSCHHKVTNNFVWGENLRGQKLHYGQLHLQKRPSRSKFNHSNKLVSSALTFSSWSGAGKFPPVTLETRAELSPGGGGWVAVGCTSTSLYNEPQLTTHSLMYTGHEYKNIFNVTQNIYNP